MNNYAAITLQILQGMPLPDVTNWPIPWSQAAEIACTCGYSDDPYDSFKSLIRSSLNGYADEIIAAVDTANVQNFITPNAVTGNNWQVYDLAHAYRERPPTQWIVEGIFRVPSLNIVYGTPGCMKTLILLDMAGCIVSGKKWLEPFKPRSTIKSPVFWCDFDNGADDMDDKVSAMGRGYNLQETDSFHYVSMPDPWLVGSDFNHESFNELVTNARTVQAKLIVVDNLGNVTDVDENSPKMAAVMSNFRRLTEVTGACVIVIHHQRKSGNTKGGRKGETLRGHSSIEASLNVALLVEREEGKGNITMMSTKTRGADIYPFGATFTFEHKPGTSDLAKFSFSGIEVHNTSDNEAIDNTIKDALSGSELNQKDLVNSVYESITGASKKTIRERIIALANDGTLDTRKGEHNATLYTYDMFK